MPLSGVRQDVLEAEAKILKGHYGSDWKDAVVKIQVANGIDLSLAKRKAIADIVTPLIAYSVKTTKQDRDDVESMRAID